MWKMVFLLFLGCYSSGVEGADVRTDATCSLDTNYCTYVCRTMGCQGRFLCETSTCSCYDATGTCPACTELYELCQSRCTISSCPFASASCTRNTCFCFAPNGDGEIEPCHTDSAAIVELDLPSLSTIQYHERYDMPYTFRQCLDDTCDAQGDSFSDLGVSAPALPPTEAATELVPLDTSRARRYMLPANVDVFLLPGPLARGGGLFTLQESVPVIIYYGSLTPLPGTAAVRAGARVIGILKHDVRARQVFAGSGTGMPSGTGPKVSLPAGRWIRVWPGVVLTPA